MVVLSLKMVMKHWHHSECIYRKLCVCVIWCTFKVRLCVVCFPNLQKVT